MTCHCCCLWQQLVISDIFWCTETWTYLCRFVEMLAKCFKLRCHRTRDRWKDWMHLQWELLVDCSKLYVYTFIVVVFSALRLADGEGRLVCKKILLQGCKKFSRRDIWGTLLNLGWQSKIVKLVEVIVSSRGKHRYFCW